MKKNRALSGRICIIEGMNNKHDREIDETETETIQQQDVLSLASLDQDPVSNESSFRLSDEIFELRNSRQYIEDFESLVDMAGN